MKTVKPPICPACGVSLTRVDSAGKSVWYYDQGHYDNNENMEATLSCPNCGACLDGVFPMGIYFWGVE